MGIAERHHIFIERQPLPQHTQHAVRRDVINLAQHRLFRDELVVIVPVADHPQHCRTLILEHESDGIGVGVFASHAPVKGEERLLHAPRQQVSVAVPEEQINVLVLFLEETEQNVLDAVVLKNLSDVVKGKNFFAHARKQRVDGRAEKIDKGSMTGFLATPVSRTQIVGASTCYLVLSLAAMWATASVVGIVCADAFQPGALDRDTFLLLNLGAFLYHLAISAISFCASCVFNSSKASLIVGGGLPLLFFVISLLLKLSDDLEVLRYFTLNTLYDTQRIVDGSDYQMQLVALLVIAMVLYTCGLLIFRRKDLPL